MLHLMRPDDASAHVEALDGVNCSVAVAAEDLTVDIDWRIAAWDQVVEVVRDPYLSQPSILGTMHGHEETKCDGRGKLLDGDRNRFWSIATHGEARSAERNAWYAQIRHDPL